MRRCHWYGPPAAARVDRRNRHAGRCGGYSPTLLGNVALTTRYEGPAVTAGGCCPRRTCRNPGTDRGAQRTRGNCSSCPPPRTGPRRDPVCCGPSGPCEGSPKKEASILCCGASWYVAFAEYDSVRRSRSISPTAAAGKPSGATNVRLSHAGLMAPRKKKKTKRRSRTMGPPASMPTSDPRIFVERVMRRFDESVTSGGTRRAVRV
jgi:hypothetical protein